MNGWHSNNMYLECKLWHNNYHCHTSYKFLSTCRDKNISHLSSPTVKPDTTVSGMEQHVQGHVSNISRGMSPTSPGVCLQHLQGYVYNISWPGVCLQHLQGYVYNSILFQTLNLFTEFIELVFFVTKSLLTPWCFKLSLLPSSHTFLCLSLFRNLFSLNTMLLCYYLFSVWGFFGINSSFLVLPWSSSTEVN